MTSNQAIPIWTPEQETLQSIRQAIAELSADDAVRVRSIAITLRNVVKAGGALAQLAFALVGAELAAEEKVDDQG